MKTILTTVAIVIAMSTAANANTREPLGDCLIKAFVEGIALQNDVTEDMLMNHLKSNAGKPQRDQLLNQTNIKVEFIVASKYAGEPLSYVLNLLSTEDHVLNSLEAECIIDYYSESA